MARWSPPARTSKPSSPGGHLRRVVRLCWAQRKTLAGWGPSSACFLVGAGKAIHLGILPVLVGFFIFGEAKLHRAESFGGFRLVMNLEILQLLVYGRGAAAGRGSSRVALHVSRSSLVSAEQQVYV